MKSQATLQIYRTYLTLEIHLASNMGLIAERLFVDDQEAKNSPVQSFGGIPAQGGDIKYRDVNGDGQINELDKVPLGYPTTPEIVYGFGFSFGYKAFDISSFFQGSARSSFFIDPNAITPFVQNGGSQKWAVGSYCEQPLV